MPLPRLTGALVGCLALTAACGSARATGENGPSPSAPPPRPASAVATTSPDHPHVMVIMMENRGYSEVIGQPAQPFTNLLASSNGSATESFGFGHPSLPNYLVFVSGSTQGVTDDDPPSSHSFRAVPTLADQLAAAQVSAKAYAEELPSHPRSDSGNYTVRHFPWVYFPGTSMPISKAGNLLRDLNAPNPPAFVWYTPDVIDDEHNGTARQGDAFLARLVSEVQTTVWYRQSGQIIIEWDESDSDSSGLNGSFGGHVPTIVVSTALQASPVQDPAPVDTAGILASIESCYRLGHLGAAADPRNGTIDALLRDCPAAGS